MKAQQLDIFRNRSPTPADWLAAAESARSNPYESPDAAERRARYYETQAHKLSTTEQGSNA